MGLKGNLATVSLADVFQVLSHGHSSGLLRIQTKDGSRFIEIEEGSITIVARSTNRILLGDLLLARGLISEETLQSALTTQKQTEKLLGSILIEQDLVPRESIESAVQFQIEEEICDLFMLKEAEFDFLANAKLDAKMALAGGFMRLKIDPNAMLLEAARRMNDWQNVEQRIASQSTLFDLAEAGRELLESGEGLSSEGMILLKLIDDKRSVEAMVQKGCLGRINTNNMLIELWDANMIRPAAPEVYAEIARKHLERGRLSEARRLAQYGLDLNSTTSQQDALKKVVDDVDRKIEMGTRSAQMSRERSEVIRRRAPNIIIQRKKSAKPYVIAALFAFLALGGGASYFLWLKPKTERIGEIKDLERRIEAARALMGENKYEEALNEFNRVYQNQNAKDRLKEGRKKVFDEIEEKAALFLKRFRLDISSKDDDLIKKLSDELTLFEKVIPLFKGIRYDQMVEAARLLQAWQQEKRAEELAGRFETILREHKGQTRVKPLMELLAERPIEKVAVKVREELARLRELARRSAHDLAVAKQCEEARDLTRALARFTSIAKGVSPESELATKATARAEAIRKELTASKREANLIYQKIRRGNRAGWTDFKAFVQKKPDRTVLASSCRALMAVVPRPVEQAGEQLRQQVAEFQRAGKVKEANDAIKKLAAEYPFTSAASKVMRKLKVTSEPQGAEIVLNEVSTGKQTPAEINVPAIGLVRIALRKAGFRNAELSLKSDHAGPVKVNMTSEPVLPPVLMPYSAKDGMALHAGVVAVLNGNEVTLWRENKKDADPLMRVGVGHRFGATKDKRNLHNPLFLNSGKHDELELLVPSLSGRLWRVNVEKGIPRSMSLESAPVSRPVPIKYPEEEHKFMGIATANGFECHDLTASLVHRNPIKLGPKPGSELMGIAFNQKTLRLFIPRPDGKLYAVHAETLIAPWNKELPEDPLGPPVLNATGTRIGLAGAKGTVSIWQTKDGEKQFDCELGGACKLGLLQTPAGLLAVTEAGKLVMIDPDAGKDAESKKELWTRELGKGVELAPVAMNGKYLVVPQGSEVKVLDLRSGEVLWSTKLSDVIVRMAAAKGKLYISTQDAYLTILRLE